MRVAFAYRTVSEPAIQMLVHILARQRQAIYRMKFEADIKVIDTKDPQLVKPAGMRDKRSLDGEADLLCNERNTYNRGSVSTSLSSTELATFRYAKLGPLSQGTPGSCLRKHGLRYG